MLKIRNTFAILLAVVAFAGMRPQAKAQSTIATDLDGASSFAVLSTTVTFGSGNAITGDIGYSTITGYPSSLIGVDRGNNSLTQAAQTALSTAFTYGNSLTPTTLTGNSATPGVYSYSAELPNTLTLSGSGVYIFQIGTLNTATHSVVTLTGGAQANNVFWVVGTATLGGESAFEGTILASSTITVGEDTTINGELLGTTVTLGANDTVITAVPEPADTSLLIAGFVGLIVGVQRMRRHYSERKPGFGDC